MPRHEQAAAFADRIEAELRRIEVWQSEPPPPEAFRSRQAFFGDTMSFYQWLQFVLLARVREIVSKRGAFPSSSSVGAYAVRELDGCDEAGQLIGLLCDFDEFIEQKPPSDPVGLTRLYWETRDRNLLVRYPHAPPGYDTTLAERVFHTAAKCIEIPAGPEEIEEGVAVRTVLQADRGPWLVLTCLCKQRDEWRVDLPLSIGRTMMMFLRQQQIHPPYTNDADARGRAMQWWEHVHNHNDRFARELLLDPVDEVPHFTDGQVDEFFWYLSHTEGGGQATVRVLMNTRTANKVWDTRMVERGGAWFVDWQRTLIGS